MIVYIEELGAPKDMIDWYAGLAVSLSALSSALISPVWGRFADRYGRKPMMVRASLAMTFTMGGVSLCSQCVLVVGFARVKWFAFGLCAQFNRSDC